MSKLTHRMKTARSDYYGSNLTIWFPCNAGSGNSITDSIAGITQTDDGSTTYTQAHAVGFNATGNRATNNLGNIIIPKQGLYVGMAKVATSFALTQLILGNSSSGPGMSLAGSALALIGLGASCSAAVSSSAAAGDTCIWAAAWDTNNIYSYEGKNAAATLQNTTALPAAVKTALGAKTKFDSALTFLDRSFTYGLALFDFSTGGLPSDLLTQVNWMRARWLVGDKVTPPGWKSLS